VAAGQIELTANLRSATSNILRQPCSRPSCRCGRTGLKQSRREHDVVSVVATSLHYSSLEICAATAILNCLWKRLAEPLGKWRSARHPNGRTSLFGRRFGAPACA